jgi:hypothetical protein
MIYSMFGNNLTYLCLVHASFAVKKMKILYVMDLNNIIGLIVQCYEDVKIAIKFVFNVLVFLLLIFFIFLLGCRNRNLYRSFITRM